MNPTNSGMCVSVAVMVGVLAAARTSSQSAQTIDLAGMLTAKKLRSVNREVIALAQRNGAVHLSEGAGNGVVWIQGTEFANGTIEVDVRGRDLLQRSFIGLAFHRKDDDTYDAVYVRPFNFRVADPVRHRHAVQYVALPEYDWSRLREQFPDEFENPVDQSIVPVDWVHLRIVARGRTIQMYVGPVQTPTLEVRKLGLGDRGMIGLFTGNNSDGDFANLRITP